MRDFFRNARKNLTLSDIAPFLVALAVFVAGVVGLILILVR